MRRWLWIGTFGVAFSAAGIGSYWYFTHTTVVKVPEMVVIAQPIAVTPGDTEQSEPEVEPIRVEGARMERDVEFGEEIGMQPPVRAFGNPGAPQPPRPDRIPGTVPRMPYADEEEVLVLPQIPMARILQETPLSKLNLFKDMPEESETPVTETPAMPNYHPHQQYCPYQGGHCPAPIRVMPRD
jgi:hypothetical protein